MLIYLNWRFIMNKLIDYKKLSAEKQKLFLYKLSEIYINDDVFLNSIEQLEENTVSTILDFVFSENEIERKEKRAQLNKNFKANLDKVKQIKTKSNNLIRNYDEFIEKNEELKELLDLESQF